MRSQSNQSHSTQHSIISEATTFGITSGGNLLGAVEMEIPNGGTLKDNTSNNSGGIFFTRSNDDTYKACITIGAVIFGFGIYQLIRNILNQKKAYEIYEDNIEPKLDVKEEKTVFIMVKNESKKCLNILTTPMSLFYYRIFIYCKIPL